MDRLADEQMRRLRIATPFVAVVLLLGVITSESAGIPISVDVYVVNAISIGVGALLAALIWTGRVPSRRAWPVAALTWSLLPGTTLATFQLMGDPQLMVALFGALFVAPAIVISRHWLLLVTSMCALIWVALVDHVAPVGADLTFLKVVGLGAAAFANAAGLAQWRMMTWGARIREELHESNERLSEELAERRRAEEEREAFRDQFVAAQRNEAIGNLAAGIAHEMNNVLGGILTAGELLQDESDPSSRRELIEDVVREARRGGALTHGLLAFARRGQYRRAPASPDGMVDELCRVLPRTIDRRVELERRGRADVQVDVDRAQLMQAILNLAINGADAMPDGGRLTLSTDVRDLGVDEAEQIGVESGRYAVVSVEDTGTGMDDETRRRVFEPFFTTKGPGKGTGLGLSMVHGAVRAHDGTIQIESALEKGTTVSIFLPVREGRVVQLDSARDGAVDGQGCALIIDDEPIIRASLGKVLQRIGFSVVAAADGREGLAAFESREDYALVLCDMNMPVMDGAACIRAMRRRSSVPIVVISGYAEEADAQALIRDGIVNGFLEKPFTSAALREAIRAALAGASGQEFPVVVRSPKLDGG